MRTFTDIGIVTLGILLTLVICNEGFSHPDHTVAQPIYATHIFVTHRPLDMKSSSTEDFMWQSFSQDTLYYTVKAGEVLIFALPELWEAIPVEHYSIVHAPALSWLVDRSFFWRTLEENVGTYHVIFEVDYPDEPADTLVVSIAVE